MVSVSEGGGPPARTAWAACLAEPERAGGGLAPPLSQTAFLFPAERRLEDLDYRQLKRQLQSFGLCAAKVPLVRSQGGGTKLSKANHLGPVAAGGGGTPPRDQPRGEGGQ